MKCPSYYMFFETISNKTRFKIIDALSKGGKSVTDICKDIGEEQSKISHALKKLTECRFIDFKVEGKKRIYSLNKETITPILRLVEKHTERYCKGECIRK